MLKSKIWYLKKIRLLKKMTLEEMKKLDRITRMESVKTPPIFFPGDPSQQVYLLKEGRVKISRVSEDGREVTIALLEPGEIFGELEVLDDSQICIINKERFLSMVRKKPEFSFRLTKLIGLRPSQAGSF
ncbi:MAG: cyclic nucleotide-binding domain-containing protein [Nitrospira sp.]|nr:cyclic nucleotide-binding domain-containing protein [Candidatus Manganitrophaceae bacterium]HIL34332.1 cyclic nucleotide-binding domain-containing protein [Candidatus Manganitrophaceae bacterium]